MGSCKLIKEHGSRCGSNNGINVFYYKDGGDKWSGEIEVCQMDSQRVFGKFMIEEEKIKLRIEKLKSLRKRIWNKEKEHDETVRDLESEVTRAMQDQNKLASVNSPIERQKQVKQAMQDEVYRRMKKMGELLRDQRNKFCKLCSHELICSCSVCKSANNPRQWGEKISSATVFSQRYYRRQTYNFHIVCGRIFLNLFGKNILSTQIDPNQKTFEQVMAEAQ